MSEKYLLISGRPSTGKTELIIAYANQNIESTLILSEEDESYIKEKGLNSDVKVINPNNIDTVNILEYSTIYIDYIELFDKYFIKNILNEIKNRDIQVIATSFMGRDYSVNNVFEEYMNIKNTTQ